MTVDQNWTESPFVEGESTYAQEENPMLGEMPNHPLHVKVVDTQTQQVAPEFAALSTWQPIVAGTGVATQILPHRYHRHKAKFVWNIPANTIVYVSNKPDALSSPNPPATVYQITTGQNQPNWESQQPMYAVYTGTGPVSVAVVDESYGTVQ
jgi:hypothetical protein